MKRGHFGTVKLLYAKKDKKRSNGDQKGCRLDLVCVCVCQDNDDMQNIKRLPSALVGTLCKQKRAHAAKTTSTFA